MNNDAVVLADAKGVIRFWSEAAERAFGHKAGAAVGQTLDLMVPSEFREAHWSGFRRAVDCGTASVEGQAAPFPVLRADGGVIEHIGRLTLVRRPDGLIVGAMVVFDQATPEP